MLNEKNYYSLEMDRQFCSNSQLKNFKSCEHKAMKILSGEYVVPTTEAMMLGSLVDHVLTEDGTIEGFVQSHPDMISSRGKTAGCLKSAFTPAYGMISRCQNDQMFMKFLDGEHQKIVTGTIYGLPFKAKLDCYIPGKAIVDLKTVASIRGKVWSDELGKYTTFIEAYDYITQLAIYQELVFQNTGEMLPCYIAAVSKEQIPDIEIIYIDNETLHGTLHGDDFHRGIADLCESIRLLKSGEVTPTKCGHCEICVSEKKIERPISWLELEGEIR